MQNAGGARFAETAFASRPERGIAGVTLYFNIYYNFFI